MDLDFPPFGVILQALIRDLVGPVGIAQNVSGETHGSFLASFRRRRVATVAE